MSLSIVIPTYNGEKYIEETILSAIEQTVSADEIIISDDNSDDNTLKICKRYSDKVKIFTEPKGPSGFVNGWNNAIAKASSDYISVLHQDDTLHSTFVEEINGAIAQHPDVRHLFVPCCYIDARGELLNEPNYCNNSIRRYTGVEYLKAYQRVGNPHIHRCPGVVTHHSIFEECQYRAEAGHIADDDFFYRVGQYTDIVGVLKPLASYRLHGESETGHLDDISLVRRIIRDLSFQIKHSQENPLFTRDNTNFIRQERRKFIKRYIGYCIKRRDIYDMLYPLKYLF